MCLKRGFIWVLGLLVLTPLMAYGGPREVASELTLESLKFGSGIDFKSEVTVDTGNAQEVDAISIHLPSAIENGNAVPVEVTSTLPNVSTLELLSNRHANPIASFAFGPNAVPYVNTRFRVGKSGNLYALVKSAFGEHYSSAKIVDIVKHGQSNLTACGFKRSLLAAKRVGDLIVVTIMVEHCMNLDNYIRKLRISKDGEVIAEVALTSGISRNPFFRFKFKGTRDGVYRLRLEDSFGSSGTITRTY